MVVTSLLYAWGFVLKSAVVSISLSIVGMFAETVFVFTELDYT